MTSPLHSGIGRPERRPSDGHAGLWFDKFCDRWRLHGTQWSMKSEKSDDGNNPKLDWINTLADGLVGNQDQINEYVLRLMRLVERREGQFGVFTAEARFVTGLGGSHPVGNGFAFHPTLATPYLPGTSIKGLVRACAKFDMDPLPSCEIVERVLGDTESVGCINFLDAIPINPVSLEADVVTPHYANWTKAEPPGDWRSPTPIPFLATAAKTSFLFGIVPSRSASDGDLRTVMSWLSCALSWSGGGAKTAVGYGRFERDGDKTDELRQRLRDRDRAHETRKQEEQEARERQAKRAAMSPTEREIEEILDLRQDRNTPEITTILRVIEDGRWTGDAKVEVAEWLEDRMKQEKRWKETSQKKRPGKDRDYQNTLRVMGWLRGE